MENQIHRENESLEQRLQNMPETALQDLLCQQVSQLDPQAEADALRFAENLSQHTTKQ